MQLILQTVLHLHHLWADKGNIYILNETLVPAFVPKNPTNALMYVNTALFTLFHSYMFQPSRGHPQGVLMYFVNRVNKMHVQM